MIALVVSLVIFSKSSKVFRVIVRAKQYSSATSINEPILRDITCLDILVSLCKKAPQKTSAETVTVATNFSKSYPKLFNRYLIQLEKYFVRDDHREVSAANTVYSCNTNFSKS